MYACRYICTGGGSKELQTRLAGRLCRKEASVKCVWATGCSQTTWSTEPWFSIEEGVMRQAGEVGGAMVKDLSAKANESGFDSEGHEKRLGSMNLNVLNSDVYQQSRT